MHPKELCLGLKGKQRLAPTSNHHLTAPSSQEWPKGLEGDCCVARANPGPSGAWWLGDRRVVGRATGTSALLTSLFLSGYFDLRTSRVFNPQGMERRSDILSLR